jgi:hypothetical protein
VFALGLAAVEHRYIIHPIIKRVEHKGFEVCHRLLTVFEVLGMVFSSSESSSKLLYCNVLIPRCPPNKSATPPPIEA